MSNYPSEIVASFSFKNEKFSLRKIITSEKYDGKFLIFAQLFQLSLCNKSANFIFFIKSHVQSFLHARWRKFSFASQTNAFDYKFVPKLILAKGLVYFQLMVFRFLYVESSELIKMHSAVKHISE